MLNGLTKALMLATLLAGVAGAAAAQDGDAARHRQLQRTGRGL